MAKWLNYLIPKKKSQHKAVLGVSITTQGAAWCVLENGAERPTVSAHAAVEGHFRSPKEGFAALLAQQVPPALPCHISLSHHFYQMLLVDAPNVPDAEMRDAVKWRVKDLITQPIEKMVVDVFRLPSDAYRGRMNMVYSALIEQAAVAPLVSACDDAGLALESVGIAELALANLSRHIAETENRSLALLFLTGNDGSINLIENGYLYLTRTLEMQGSAVYSGNVEFNQDPTDNLALDVQRSLDYYESQLGKSGVTRLYLVTESVEQQLWCDDLSQRLPVRAQALPLADIVQLPQELGTFQQGLLMPAVGMALGAQHGTA